MWVVVVVVGVCGANWSPTEGQAEKKEYRSAQELACQSPPLSISYWEFKGQVDPQHKCDGSSHADCHEVTKSGRLSAGAEGGRDGGREGETDRQRLCAPLMMSSPRLGSVGRIKSFQY